MKVIQEGRIEINENEWIRVQLLPLNPFQLKDEGWDWRFDTRKYFLWPKFSKRFLGEKFEVEPHFQILAGLSQNTFLTFIGRDQERYYVNVQYDQATNMMYPPV